MYSENSIVHRRWSLSETVNFLNLLKKYPVLIQKCSMSVDMIERRKLAFESLLDDCLEADLDLKDVKGLRTKVESVKNSFAGALASYREKVRQNVRNPKMSLPWFDKAHFLDTTGYLRRLKEKKRSTTTIDSPAKYASTPVNPIPPPSRQSTVTRGSIRPTRSNSSSANVSRDLEDPSTSTGGTGIKIEVHNGYPDDSGAEQSDGEISGQRTAEADEWEQGGVDSEHEEEMQRWHQSAPSATVPRYEETPVNVAGRQTDYFAAFLDYAKLRSKDYAGRQKRDIINVLTNAMNRIDEEKDALAGQSYSIQMYSYADLNESAAMKE